MTQMYDISNYNPGAFLTNLKNEALQKYKQYTSGSGTGSDIAVRTASGPNYAVRAQELAKPFIGMAKQYGFGDDPSKIQGLGSDVRHTVGTALGRDAVIDNIAAKTGLDPNQLYSGGLLKALGNVAIIGGTIAQEIPDAIRGVRESGLAGLNQPIEDVRANLRAINVPYNTPEETLVNYAVEQSPSAYMASGIPIQLNAIYPSYFEDKEEFDRTGRGVYAGRPVYYSEGPDLPQGGLVYSGTAEDLQDFYSSMQ
tara:strand:- start:276 stop:1037 length:762 start_codon:yes stop_codon:yes gene_type:complete